MTVTPFQLLVQALSNPTGVSGMSLADLDCLVRIARQAGLLARLGETLTAADVFDAVPSGPRCRTRRTREGVAAGGCRRSRSRGPAARVEHSPGWICDFTAQRAWRARALHIRPPLQPERSLPWRARLLCSS